MTDRERELLERIMADDETDDEPARPGPHRLADARLGVRRPEYAELSERVAEANRRSREAQGLNNAWGTL